MLVKHKIILLAPEMCGVYWEIMTTLIQNAATEKNLYCFDTLRVSKKDQVSRTRSLWG